MKGLYEGIVGMRQLLDTVSLLNEAVTAYHSTFGDWSGDFRVDDSEMGIHFGSEEAANNRIGIKRAEHKRDYGHLSNNTLGEPRVIKCELNIHKPLRMTETANTGRPGDGSWNANRVWNTIVNSIYHGNSIIPSPLLTDGEVELIHDDTPEEIINSTGESASDAMGHGNAPLHRDWLVKWLEDKGYDSIVYNNTFEGGGDSYIVFHPRQIKVIPQPLKPIKLQGFNRPH